MSQLSLTSRGLFLLALGATLPSCKGDDGKSGDPDPPKEQDEVVDSALFTVAETARFDVGALTCPVHVVRTEGNVPHIYAADRHDLAVAMGFVFASDRYFFLDLARRLSLGQVSAILGQDALETDIDARASGMTHVADTLLANLTADQAAHMDAYAEGANAYIDAVAAGTLPPPSELEIAGPLLGASTPTDLMEPFTRRDLAGALASLVYELGYETEDVGNTRKAATLAAGLYDSDVALAELREAGALHDAYALMAPVYDDVSAPGFDVGSGSMDAVMPVPGPVPLSVLARLESRLERLEKRLGHDDEIGWGSNSWAVAGSATADGRALVAGDGHLPLTVPSLFWQMGLDTRELGGGDTHQLGLGLPGFPYMAVGTNGEVAWSQTQLGGDITDWYAEELVLDSDGTPSATMFEGAQAALSMVEESIEVAEVVVLGSVGRTETFTRYITADGRFVMDIEGLEVESPSAAAGGEAAVRIGSDWVIPQDIDGDGIISAISFDYTGLDPSGIVGVLDAWGHSGDVEEMHEAARGLVAYSQNIVAADTSGSIWYTGYQAVPCRGYLDRDADGTWAEGADPTMLIDGTRYGGFTVPLDADQKVDESVASDPERCMVPHAEYPYSIDPPQGWVATANNDPGGHSLDNVLENDAWYIGGPWDGGARMHRIAEQLDAQVGAADVQSMADLQADHQSPTGRIFAPELVDTLRRAAGLRDVDFRTEEEERVVALYEADMARFEQVADRIADWSDRGFIAASGVESFYNEPGTEDLDDAVATTIFNAWKGQLARLALDDEAIGQVWRTSGNTSRMRTLKMMFEGRGPDNPLDMASWNDATQESAYWDLLGTETIETSDEVVLSALSLALDFLESEPTEPGAGGFGTSDMEYWLWGLRHTVTFDSVLAEFLGDDPSFSFLTDQFSITTDVLPLADELATEDPRRGMEGFPRPGDTESVDASNFGWNPERFTYGSGPVFRMAIALGPDGVEGLNVLPGGQSALVDSPYFADQAAAWLGNEAWPMRFSPAQVIEGALGREVLLPTSGDRCGQAF